MSRGSLGKRPVWLVRAGKCGEDEPVALERGLAVLGFREVPDFTGARNKAAILKRVRRANPEWGDARTFNRAAQLTAFILRIREGDIVALPLKTQPGSIALGRATGPYSCREIEGEKRHTRSVNWLLPSVPSSSFQQDLLYSLGAAMTVCRIRRNHAEERFAAILGGSTDPGWTG